MPPDTVERPARERFAEFYATGNPPWDIGRPQPAVLRLAREGWLAGDVLDMGCGTGANAVALAEAGCRVLGIDFVPQAVEAARRRARERGVEASFQVGDALAPGLGDRSFDGILDCGLFHAFDDADRARYVASLRSLLRPGGRLAVLCFSDREPGDEGPRRVREEELREAFGEGWRVDALTPDRFEHEGGHAEAWLLLATRTEA